MDGGVSLCTAVGRRGRGFEVEVKVEIEMTPSGMTKRTRSSGGAKEQDRHQHQSHHPNLKPRPRVKTRSKTYLSSFRIISLRLPPHLHLHLLFILPPLSTRPRVFMLMMYHPPAHRNRLPQKPLCQALIDRFQGGYPSGRDR